VLFCKPLLFGEIISFSVLCSGFECSLTCAAAGGRSVPALMIAVSNNLLTVWALFVSLAKEALAKDLNVEINKDGARVHKRITFLILS
jgi:hypothetical protein